jgi:CysZ protein
MKHLITQLPPSFKALLKDKVNFILMMIPVIIGVIIYSFGFWHVYEFLTTTTESYLQNTISSENLGTVLFWVFKIILFVFGFFLINWTFVLIVSLIASPFNDLISERVEKKHLEQNLPNLSDAFSSMAGKLFFTLFNETKKILFIGLLSVAALIMGYIPILTPIALVITFILVTVQFLDYSWARHDLPFKKCMTDVLKNIIPYTITGGLFFLLINIPFINLFVPAWATSYMTLYWIKKRQKV